MHRGRLFFLSLSLLCAAHAYAAAPTFKQFLEQFEKAALLTINAQVQPQGPLPHKITAATLKQWLKPVRFEPAGVQLFAPSISPDKDANHERQFWPSYQEKMVDQQRIKAGAAYLQQHQKWFELAQERYGVPPAVVVAILSIETRLGKLSGSFRSLDTLLSLAYAYPASPKQAERKAFFKQEAIHLLVLALLSHNHPLSYQGSFAGAIGIGQFMPSSILQYAVDFDADGKVDLLNSPADVIASVAHYLQNFGWDAQTPLFYAPMPLNLAAELVHARESTGITPPSLTAHDLMDLPVHLPPHDYYGVISLPIHSLQRQYFVVNRNFFVLTRYNHSYRYALAVTLLAEAIDARASARPAADPESSAKDAKE